MYRRIIFIAIILLLLTSCDKSTAPDGHIAVRVLDENMQPVEGAFVKGGGADDYYKVTTNDDGLAFIRENQQGHYAEFFKDNYYTIPLTKLYPIDYILESTPKRFAEIGQIEGEILNFGDDSIVTVGDSGLYRVYDYSNENVELTTTQQLTENIVKAEIYYNVLVCRTSDNYFYIYFIDNITSPLFKYNLNVTADNIGTFALNDSLLFIVGINSFSDYELLVYSLPTAGQPQLVGQAEFFQASYLLFMENYLIAIGKNPLTYKVFDISDIEHIEELYTSSIPGYGDILNRGDSLILSPSFPYYESQMVIYALMDISDRLNPVIDYSHFYADGLLQYVINDSVAVGLYHADNHSLSVFIRNGYFKAQTVSSESGHWRFEGFNPPYYVFADKLYKVVDY